MAVAFDALSGTVGDFVSDPSWTHTPVGTPTYITVDIFKQRAGSIDSVTYAGVTMTQNTSLNIGTNFFIYRYILESPTSGAQTVQVNTTGNVQVSAQARSWTGTKTTGVSGTTATSTGTGTATATAAVSSKVNDLVVDTVARGGVSGTDIVEDAGQTSNFETAPLDGTHGGSTESGATSVTMGWTFASGTFGHIVNNLQQAESAHFLNLLGVGT